MNTWKAFVRFFDDNEEAKMLAADPGFLPAVWLDKDDVRPRSVVAESIRP